jgi:hypothetical protein
MTALDDEVSAAAEADDWVEANRLVVNAELTRISARLLALTGRAGPGDVAAADAAAAEARETPALHGMPPVIDTLREVFALTGFETDVLVLAAAHELDPRVAGLCASAGDARHPHPTFALAMAALADPHWSALTPGGPLRAWRLVDVGAGPLTAAPLSVDERVLHALLAMWQLDRRLEPFVTPVTGTAGMAASHARLAASIAAAWTADGTRVVRVVGRDADDRRDVVAAAAAAMGARCYAVPAADLPATVDERDAFVRLWQREQALGRLVLLIESDMASDAGSTAALSARLGWWVAVSARERADDDGYGRGGTVVEVATPTRAEQRELWHAGLRRRAGDAVAPVVAQFDLSATIIHRVAARLAAGGDTAAGAVWAACRDAARPELAWLADRVDVRAGWNDLILPQPQLDSLQDLVLHVRHRVTVHEEWGFSGASSRGLGAAALFAGPSGTGKTLAAEVIAGELGLDLYRIDLSRVVSKYIGETEKNLCRVFDAAEGGGAVLLFDEADALFGKRTEVRDSHDRYANIEVSYLLARMESYRGLAILTTNMRTAIDDAFMRRLRFVVAFPFPDAAMRRQMWERVFPPGVPLDELPIEALSRLSVTGGMIANIALGAAFQAADRGGRVCAADLVRAAQREYAKLDRPLTDAEIGGLR